MPIPPDMLDDLRKEMMRELTRLARSLALAAEANRPVALDQQAVGRLSRMDSLQSQQMSQGLTERQEARQAALHAALGRLENGNYGVCSRCGREIATGRLFAVPEADDCGACGDGGPTT